MPLPDGWPLNATSYSPAQQDPSRFRKVQFPRIPFHRTWEHLTRPRCQIQRWGPGEGVGLIPILNMKDRFCLLLIPLLLTGLPASLSAQARDITKVFLVVPNRPYVYLRFDHVGKGPRIWAEEPETRIWFRLVNNCRLSIVVNSFGVPNGRPKDELGVMYKIVADVPPNQFILPSNGSPEVKIWKKATPEELPRDYMLELGSLLSIPAGNSILFSIPVNHLGERWHVEIPFQFELPRGPGVCPPICRDPNNSGIVSMAIPYGIYDLPPKVRAEIEN